MQRSELLPGFTLEPGEDVQMVKDFLSRRVAVMRFGSQYGNHPARAELDRVAAIIKAAMTR